VLAALLGWLAVNGRKNLRRRRAARVAASL
jgi:hypothetical protein